MSHLWEREDLRCGEWFLCVFFGRYDGKGIVELLKKSIHRIKFIFFVQS